MHADDTSSSFCKIVISTISTLTDNNSLNEMVAYLMALVILMLAGTWVFCFAYKMIKCFYAYTYVDCGDKVEDGYQSVGANTGDSPNGGQDNKYIMNILRGKLIFMIYLNLTTKLFTKGVYQL